MLIAVDYSLALFVFHILLQLLTFAMSPEYEKEL